MPGGPNYPKDRVATTVYEKGGVQSTTKAKPVSGSDSGNKPKRAGEEAGEHK